MERVNVIKETSNGTLVATNTMVDGQHYGMNFVIGKQVDNTAFDGMEITPNIVLQVSHIPRGPSQGE